MQPIILASSSSYRRILLEKLGIEFDCHSPNIDESITAEESPEKLVLRLSEQKAKTVARSYTNHLIIGSDQVACLSFNGQQEILTKPGNHANAIEQLSRCSGNKVIFYTGLTLLNSKTNSIHQCVDLFTVYFRTLSLAQIENYLKREPAYDCAGSFKVEGLGISLFKRLQGDDPNSLIGLPLIKLIDFLTLEGLDILRNGANTSSCT